MPSTRPVTIVTLLHQYRERQQQEREHAGSDWQDYGLVFCTSIGTPLQRSNLLRFFKLLLGHAGLPPIRFHDLRHIAATLLTKQGAQPHVTQAILGHSDMRISQMVYTHVLDESKQEAVDALMSLFDTPAEEE